MTSLIPGFFSNRGYLGEARFLGNKRLEGCDVWKEALEICLPPCHQPLLPQWSRKANSFQPRPQMEQLQHSKHLAWWGQLRDFA